MPSATKFVGPNFAPSEQIEPSEVYAMVCLVTAVAAVTATVAATLGPRGATDVPDGCGVDVTAHLGCRSWQLWNVDLTLQPWTAASLSTAVRERQHGAAQSRLFLDFRTLQRIPLVLWRSVGHEGSSHAGVTDAPSGRLGGSQ